MILRILEVNWNGKPNMIVHYTMIPSLVLLVFLVMSQKASFRASMPSVFKIYIYIFIYLFIYVYIYKIPWNTIEMFVCLFT